MIADTPARQSRALDRKRRPTISAVISSCGAPSNVTPQATYLDVSCMTFSCSRCHSSRDFLSEWPQTDRSTKTCSRTQWFCNTRRRRRWSFASINRSSKVGGRKLQLLRSSTSLLSLYLGMYSSSFIKNVSAENWVDSTLKAFGSGRRIESTRNGQPYTNKYGERKAGVKTDDIDAVDDENDDDLLGDLLSDYDHSLDISSRDEAAAETESSNPGPTPSYWQNPRLKMQSQDNGDNPNDSNNGNTEKNKDSVIILSAVDGTLAGISRTSGRLLWKQSKDSAINDDGEVESSPVEWNQFLSPLVSTTTKALESSEKHSIHNYQWHAVPSIDGTVYLTGGDDANTGGGPTGHELSVSMHIRDLVDRAPFVDAQRFFVGSRKAMVAAIDERTGEILRVIPKWNQGEDEDDGQLPPSLEGRDVVWIGRLEHTVTVHDLHMGTVDIEFSVAEILSVDEMIHGDHQQRVNSPSSLVIRDEEDERLFTDHITEALRHPSFGDRILSLPAPDNSEEKKVNSNARGGSSINQGSPFFVSTPSGNVAFRDHCRYISESCTAGWVSFGLLESPVVYAIEASSGRKIRVNMLDDSSISSSESHKDGLPQLLEKQIASIEQSSSLPMGMIDDACKVGKSGECRAVALSVPTPVVGELQNGQIYALPLGERISRPQPPLRLSQPHLMASEMVNSNNPHELMPSKLNKQHATIGFHQNRHDSSSDDVDSGDNQHVYIKHGCTPSSPLYPGCLIGASLIMGNLLDDDGNVDMAAFFESSDLDYDLYLDMLEGNASRKKNSVFQQFLKIMSSWIAPTVALLFVVSFEMGRRERLKREAKNLSNSFDASGGGTSAKESKEAQNSSQSQGGVIQLSEEILGFGGHGTIVYKGVLDKRQVAVKRLLNMYHASADREIELLIESDGHPNVVRYFLKEMRGDFVYLALELCDMSLNDLIGSLTKLGNMRKENFQVTVGSGEDFESATKSLLFQIASGVRHIHSLRIVHRDLKPQNILLALRSKSKPVMKTEEHGSSDSDTEVDDCTHTTCSDTNSILECFKNQEYVPKISDMGLGKQLAGQSSFGLSTLGNNSVGGGLAGDAGAGAGSVGWQAPEVMAQRFLSPEASSNADASELSPEASPLDFGVNRTSRSVDIFSLGCIFYCTILPGSHPFGEWYEREANIMKNSPNREDLEFVSPDASDLILSMIHRNSRARPTADEVCEHPFFWSLSKRLKFLCDVSDRIELCDMSQHVNTSASIIFAIEKGAVDVFGTSWEKLLDHELIQASVSRRTYDPSSVRDLLRMIRNKHHHYDELPADLKCRIGSSTDGLSSYVMRTFPRLLMHCYRFCVSNLVIDDSLVADYKLPISGKFSLKSIKSDRGRKEVITDLSALEKSMETIPDVDDAEQEEDVEQDNDLAKNDDDQMGSINTPSVPPELDEESAVSDTNVLNEPDEPLSSEAEFFPSFSRSEELDINLPRRSDDLSGIIVWSGSNAAKDLSCRGWYRSDDEWTQRLDVKLGKRDTNLARCAEDPKFRTRLCNHFDVSLGTHCPMRKKNKCIFAHGPVELRVKEGKRHRWGTLVNKHGLSANPKASGGEDTYGAARTIENTRKEQGQWAVESKQKTPQGKGKPKVIGKQAPKNK